MWHSAYYFFNGKIHANIVSRRFRLSMYISCIGRSHSLALHHLQLLSNGFDYLCLCVSPTMPRNIFTSVSATTLLSFRLPNKGHITIHRYPAETFGQTLCYNISLYFTPTQFEIWLQLKEKTLNTFHKESNEWGNHSLLVMHSLAIFIRYRFYRVLSKRSSLRFINCWPADPFWFLTTQSLTITHKILIHFIPVSKCIMLIAMHGMGISSKNVR